MTCPYARNGCSALCPVHVAISKTKGNLGSDVNVSRDHLPVSLNTKFFATSHRHGRK